MTSAQPEMEKVKQVAKRMSEAIVWGPAYPAKAAEP